MTWKNEKKSKALLVVFGIYLALLVWCILCKFALRPEEIPHLRGINLIPYAESVIVNGKVQMSEIVENMFLFLPFGLCISAFYPENARNGSARSPNVIRAEMATAARKYEVVMQGSPFSEAEAKWQRQSAVPGA